MAAPQFGLRATAPEQPWPGREAAAVPPEFGLPVGHYRVRRDARWRVVRWLPDRANGGNRAHWQAGGGYTWPPGYWHEIGARVAA